MKTQTDIIIELLFPRYVKVNHSRFISFFSDISEKKRNILKPKKKSLNISIEKIENSEDKRTSVMIKNLPSSITKEHFKDILGDVGNINYVYLPYDKKNNKFLGFAFVNVVNYKTLIQIHKKLNGKKLDNYRMKKNIEICYSKVQGKNELIQMFSKNKMHL